MKKTLLACLLLLAGSLAAGGTRTTHCFENYNVSSSSYVYDATGAQTAAAGWINCAGLKDKAIIVNVDTINGTSLDIRIEARVFIGGVDVTNYVDGELLTKSYTATTDVGDHISIPEDVDQIRVGLQVTGDSGDQDITITFVDGV